MNLLSKTDEFFAPKLGKKVSAAVAVAVKKEKRRRYETQSQFIVDVYHELQTPLSILKGNIELLYKKIDGNKPGIKILETVDKTSDRISRIINDLLFLAKADFNQQAFIKKPVVFGKFLQEIYEDYQILVQNKNINFSFRNDDNVIILGDAEKLKILFLNLIVNALKHTPSGGEIELSLSKNNNHAEVIVNDTGCGILRKDLPNIFERFYRVERKELLGDKGTGLGLAICKKIVEKHEGEIDVESKLGRGTKFTVKLPII